MILPPGNYHDILTAAQDGSPVWSSRAMAIADSPSPGDIPVAASGDGVEWTGAAEAVGLGGGEAGQVLTRRGPGYWWMDPQGIVPGNEGQYGDVLSLSDGTGGVAPFWSLKSTRPAKRTYNRKTISLFQGTLAKKGYNLFSTRETETISLDGDFNGTSILRVTGTLSAGGYTADFDIAGTANGIYYQNETPISVPCDPIGTDGWTALPTMVISPLPSYHYDGGGKFRLDIAFLSSGEVDAPELTITGNYQYPYLVYMDQSYIRRFAASKAPMKRPGYVDVVLKED